MLQIKNVAKILNVNTSLSKIFKPVLNISFFYFKTVVNIVDWTYLILVNYSYKHATKAVKESR